MESRMVSRQATSPLAMASSLDPAACAMGKTLNSVLSRSKSLVFDEDQMEMPHVHSCINNMQQGVTMIKVKGPSHTITRTFYLDQDRCAIRWKPSRKADAKISIDSIREIREGPCTDTFMKHAGGQFDPACCFSIIHGNQCDTLDLVAKQRDHVTEWIVGLKFVLAGVSDEDSHTRQQRLRDQWLKTTFKSADKSGDGLLSISEVIMLLHRLNVNLSKRKVRLMFKEADTNVGDQNEGLLDFDEFVNFYKRISTRKELYLLLLRYGNGKEYMTASELAHFLEMEQKMFNVSLRHCLDIIKNFEPVPENIQNGWLGIDGFSRFLLSREGDIFNQAHTKVHQDMTRPLSHYFIATSHNTYLIGDQLLSKSSMDVYAFVLQSGCRCVEVDCWDGQDGEPTVYHGYTLTSKIPFRNVIQTINKYAFVSSPYPVIISLENHCCLQQQKKMATYMVEVFGEKLNLERPDPKAKYLPSPEQLRYKILIKAKKLPQDLDVHLESGEVSDEDSADEMDEQFKLKDSIRCMQVENLARAKLASLARESASPTRRINFKFPRMSPSKRSRSKSFSEGAFHDAETAQYLHARRSSSPKEGKRRTSLSATFGKLKLTKKKRSSLPALEPMDSHSEETLACSEFSASARLQQGKLRIRTRRTSEIAIQNKIRRHSSDTTSSASSASSSRENLDSVEQRRKHSLSFGKKSTMMLSRQLSDLVKYTISVGASDFTYNTPCWELPSFGESKAFQLAVNKAQQFSHFNKRKLSRTYPAAYRIDSSNFNPQPMWNCGVQLVALNYQTDGKSMQLNNAKFSANGQCGYILKPEILCDENYMFEPHSTEPYPGVSRKQLLMRMISGQQLPKPPQSILGERGEIIDPYVEVEIVGVPIDCARRQTQTINDNGFNPVWDETMVFTLNLPELALVRFMVWDEDPIGRDFIGQKTLPFTSLVPGYRHIHLEGLDQASLFVHVSINSLTDKPSHKGLKKKSHSKPTLTRQTTIDTPERVVRKSSFINRLKRRSSMPNMLSGGRKPRTPVVTYDEPPNSAMKQYSSEDSDKGKGKKKTVTFVTPVTFALPMTVDNWLKKRTSHYIGPIEIRMLLDHMTVSQLLTAIREDQLPITVIIDGALSKVKNVMIKKPLTPPCYEEAVKRSKLFKRHQGFNALMPHIRREVSSSTSSMSTTLPDTPTSATDSHDSSSVNSTDSTLDPFRYRHRRRIGDPRVDIYKAIMNNIRRGRCLPPEKKMHDQRMQAGKSRNITANPPHLDYSILDKSDKETEESEERNMDVLSPSLPLHTEPTTSTPVVILKTEDAEGSGSSYSSENKESDTLSDLTSSTSSGSYADKLMQPTTLDMLGRYQSASEPDTEAEEGLSISEHSSMSEEKWSKPGCGSENEVTVKYTPPSEKRKRSPVKIFGVFCSPKSPEKANRRSPQAVPEVDRETSEVHGNRNATSGRTSTEDNLPDVIQFPCNSSFPVVEAEREQQYNDLNRASDKTTSNKLKPDYNLDQSDTENNKSQDKTDCSGTFNTHSIKTSGSAMKLKAVSPEISINVTATDDIWNAHCPHSSDSEDSLSISDSSPNVTLDRLMKHLANSPGKGNAEKARPPSPIYVNINFASVQQSAHDVSGMKTGHTADMQKSDGASTVLVHRNGKTNHTETLKDSGQVRAQDSQTRPVSSTSQFSVSSSGSDTATSSSTHKMHITSPEILGQNGVPSASSSFMEYVKSAVKDTDADNNSTTSSSSADTVVDMSLEYLGKLSSTPNLPSQKASSLDCLTLQDIFDQSEYQAFVNHIKRKQTQKNSTISPLPVKKKLVLPHRNRRKVYSAKLKDSANTTLKQKSASTSSLLDQLKKLTSFEDDEEITVDGSHDQESCVIDKTRTQELQTVMSNHVSGTHGRYFPKDSPSEMNSNKLPNSMEKNNNVDKIDYNQKWESRNHFKSHASMANFSPQSTRSHSIIGKHSAVREYTPIVSDRNHTETPSRDKLSRRLPPTSIHPRSAPSTPRLSHVNTPIFPSGRPVKASVNDSISRNAQHEFRRQELTSQASRQSQQRPLRVQRFGTGVFGLITSPTKKS